MTELVPVDQTPTQQLADVRSAYDTLRAQIRAYVVDQHRRGEICRAGLNAFLVHFDLGLYRPHHTVTFTVTGTFELTREDDHGLWATENDVRHRLLVDTGHIRGVLDGTVDFDVHVTATLSDQKDL
ncbi:hypothetical protein [Cryptosporangium arvum]|uniref:Uncharacterized protein n=1 Tax=Cryptosporangium arvum DSM 44712 TaxID=927661 RepID=A0A010Z3K8_9ACTN|nr:hypothetical protein [Cryptosporangium arvum]EXG81983.1 hypothetical protein CryarDRAFT_3110 [Cryptosporangium arvum DSM 44712]